MSLEELLLNKKKLCLGMVDDILNLIWMEFIQDRNNNGTITKYAEECSTPTSRITTTKCDAITLLDSTLLKDDVHLLNDASYILILISIISIIRPPTS